MKEILELLNKYFASTINVMKIGDLKRGTKCANNNERYDNLTIMEFLGVYKIEKMYNPSGCYPITYVDYMDCAKKEGLIAMFISFCKLNEEIKNEELKELHSNNTYHSIMLKRLKTTRNQIEEVLKINKVIPLNIEFSEAINVLFDAEINKNAKTK